MEDMNTQEQVAKPVESEIAVNPITNIDQQELDCRFTYHAPKNQQPQKYVLLRDQAKSLAEQIYRLSPKSREQSLAITHLEEAIFWANAAIARRE